MGELALDTLGAGVATAGRDVARAEAITFDGLWYGEMGSDALDGALCAAAQASTLALGTAVTGALVRSPMECAYRLAGVRQLTDAEIRFGIGAQAKPIVRHQYGSDWRRPLARLTEFRTALLHIWDAWARGAPPNFRGEYYRHVYTPEPCIAPIAGAPPKVLLGATGHRARAAAARDFDGLITHPCTPLSYLRDVIAPEFAAAQCVDRADRSELVSLTMLLCVDSERGHERMVEAARLRIWYWAAAGVHQAAFEHVGLGHVPRIAMSAVRRGEVGPLMSTITDDVIERFCVIGDASHIERTIREQLMGVVDRALIVFDEPIDDNTAAVMLERIRRNS